MEDYRDFLVEHVGLQLGQEGVAFNGEVTVSLEGQEELIVFEKLDSDVLLVQYSSSKKRLIMDDVVRLLKRNDLRRSAPHPYYVVLLKNETDPRLVIRFTEENASPESVLSAVNFLKRLVA